MRCNMTPACDVACGFVTSYPRSVPVRHGALCQAPVCCKMPLTSLSNTYWHPVGWPARHRLAAFWQGALCVQAVLTKLGFPQVAVGTALKDGTSLEDGLHWLMSEVHPLTTIFFDLQDPSHSPTGCSCTRIRENDLRATPCLF
jgi:hypothetical protein